MNSLLLNIYMKSSLQIRFEYEMCVRSLKFSHRVFPWSAAVGVLDWFTTSQPVSRAQTAEESYLRLIGTNYLFQATANLSRDKLEEYQDIFSFFDRCLPFTYFYQLIGILKEKCRHQNRIRQCSIEGMEVGASPRQSWAKWWEPSAGLPQKWSFRSSALI